MFKPFISLCALTLCLAHSVVFAQEVNPDNIVLGERTTEFRVWGKYRNRAHNIRRAARALDGIVVAPGAVFSFNQAVGPRTRRTGYKPAPAILGGELGESVGGGVCQVSSTLFSAVLEAGLDIVEAQAHSRYMFYIDPGYDTTVFYGSKDFRFRNNFHFPITIQTSTNSNNQLTIQVMGMEQVYDIEIVINEVRRERAEIVRIVDNSVPHGRFRLVERGTDALVLERRVRYIPRVPGYAERSWISTINYRMTERVIRVRE